MKKKSNKIKNTSLWPLNILPTAAPPAGPIGSTHLRLLPPFCWQGAVHGTCLANNQFRSSRSAHIDLLVISHTRVFVAWRLRCSPWTHTLDWCSPFMAKLDLMDEIRPMKSRCSQLDDVQECRSCQLYETVNAKVSLMAVEWEKTHTHTHGQNFQPKQPRHNYTPDAYLDMPRVTIDPGSGLKDTT